jgi:hypothetical protein
MSKVKIGERPKRKNLEPLKRIKWEDLGVSLGGKKLRRCNANPPEIVKKKVIKFTHRCPGCREILCKGGFSHRQTCGKFECEVIDITTYEKTIQKISEFKFNILNLNILILNKNIKNLVLEYLRPSKEVFEDRIETLEIQMSNYDDKCQEYKEICKELQFLNQYK